MDFATLKTEVEAWLLDLPAGVASRTGTFVNEAIKAAAKRHNFRFMEAEVTPSPVSTTTQQRKLVDKPTDWKESRGKPYLIHQDGSTTEIDWAGSKSNMNRSHYAHQLPSEGNEAAPDEGEPRYLLEQESQIDVYPLPDDESLWDNGRHRVVIPYWKFPATLSQDSDSNFITDRGDFYVIWKAVSVGFAFNRDEERANYYMRMAEPEFRSVQRLDKRSRLPDRISLAARKDVYAGRSRSGLRG